MCAGSGFFGCIYAHMCIDTCVISYGLQDMSSKKDTSTVLHANRENMTAKSPLTSHRHYNAVNIGCESSIMYVRYYMYILYAHIIGTCIIQHKVDVVHIPTALSTALRPRGVNL